ncbi:hypothetical protein N7533_007870 [Penicillium manginii]|uniref:uncharacterized protein n=1 Tax=Penicillium manginii TaxID=203109 RepID=UPI00254891A4|nr:uncharacterized protein N7533_007870 [Penicillium manginii]KAJ5750842.1 hypothetical protein N7533_007870 [Penicillium manginii]
MLTALFLAQNPPDTKYTCTLKAGYIPSLLSDVVCAASDSLDALELFSELLQENHASSSSTGYMAFDAHVGDTACQLRALMIMALRHHLLKDGRLARFQRHVASMIDALQNVIIRARDSCRMLTAKGSNFEKFGFNRAGESRCSLLMKLGWVEPISEHETRSSGSIEEWNPDNFQQVIRLLTYSYILSKYKTFVRRKHIIGAELDPEIPIQYAARLMESDYNSKNPVFPYWTQQKRVEHDFQCMQVWLSQLSCAWLQSLAHSRGQNDKLQR